jgi:hypothetical protein
VSKLIDLEEAEASLTAEYLVKGFIPKKGMVFVWGPPKCGKSFWVFVVELGKDQDGDQMTSCAVMPAEDVVVEPVAPKGRGRATSHREFDDSFTEACINFGKVIQICGDGPKVKAVDVAQVRDEFFRRHATSETDAKKRQAASKKAFDRALQDDKLSREYPRWVDGVNQWIWKLRDKPAPQPVQQPED